MRLVVSQWEVVHMDKDEYQKQLDIHIDELTSILRQVRNLNIILYLIRFTKRILESWDI